MFLFIAACIYSCGDSGSGEKKSEDNTKADTAATTNPAPAGPEAVANEKGLELIGASDCMTCHALDRKVIGPAYTEVAKRYENNDAVVDTLISKIQKGGKGNWGEVMMTPHPDISRDDAKEMVKYILSLKK